MHIDWAAELRDLMLLPVIIVFTLIALLCFVVAAIVVYTRDLFIKRRS